MCAEDIWGDPMTELQDDRLDMLSAIDVATGAQDRRRALRIKRKVATQMTPWNVGTSAIPFSVIIEDISETGIALVHSEPLAMGSKFLVTVPRKYHGPQVVECRVIRCDPADTISLRSAWKRRSELSMSNTPRRK